MARKPKQIAIYGKGGIGKSTTTSNISRRARRSRATRSCSSAATRRPIPPTRCAAASTSPRCSTCSPRQRRVDARRRRRSRASAASIASRRAARRPGVGCAGRGIITAVELLKQQRVFEELDLDVVIYDVLGDVVCGGFAVPMREGIAEHVFTVSSADFMAIYAANNLFRGIEKFSNSGGALLGGIIANSINTDFQREIVEDFAARTSTPIVQYVPRSLTVTQAELSGKTTIEAAPRLRAGRRLSRARPPHRRARDIEDADAAHADRTSRMVGALGRAHRAARASRTRRALRAWWPEGVDICVSTRHAARRERLAGREPHLERNRQ